MRLLDLPDALRDQGVEPVIVAGFQTRGGSFSAPPRLHLRHWTAGPARGVTPSLATVTFGRPDLRHNLCQILQSREGGTRPDKAYCVSSGMAVHAGTGRWHGIERANSHGTGNEIEWSGPGEVFPQNRIETSVRIAAACQSLHPDPDGDYCCEHREYALPHGRKIDTNLDGDLFRRSVNNRLLLPNPQPPLVVPTPEEDSMELPADIVRGSEKTGEWYVSDGITKQHLQNKEHAALLISLGHAKAEKGTGDLAKAKDILPYTWPQPVLNSIRLVGSAPK